MPIYFVTILHLAKSRFKELDELDEDAQNAIYELREAQYGNLESLMYTLVKEGGLTKQDVNEMSYPEMLRWFELIKRQIELTNRQV